MLFSEWKLTIFYWNFTEICFQGPKFIIQYWFRECLDMHQTHNKPLPPAPMITKFTDAKWPWQQSPFSRWTHWYKRDVIVVLDVWFNSTHWGRVTHICISNLIIIGSDNGLSPVRRQAIIRTNAGILLIGPFGTNISKILIIIYTFSFKKMNLKMLSAKWRPFCLSFNVLKSNLIIDMWGIFHKAALKWMSINPMDDKSAFVQVVD